MPKDQKLPASTKFNPKAFEASPLSFKVKQLEKAPITSVRLQKNQDFGRWKSRFNYISVNPLTASYDFFLENYPAPCALLLGL